MLVASCSTIHYRSFAWHLSPVALAGLVVDFVLLWMLYGTQLRGTMPSAAPELKVRAHRPLLIKSSLAAFATVILFAAGFAVSNVALGIGAWLLVTRRVRPEKIYRDIDWTLLVLFIGLFVVVAGLETTGIDRDVFAALRPWHLERALPLAVA